VVRVRDRADRRKELRETIAGVRRSFYRKTAGEVRQKCRDALANDDGPEFVPADITVAD
jgi:hypothetical protein